jgi:hypothetical protein
MVFGINRGINQTTPAIDTQASNAAWNDAKITITSASIQGKSISENGNTLIALEKSKRRTVKKRKTNTSKRKSPKKSAPVKINQQEEQQVSKPQITNSSSTPKSLGSNAVRYRLRPQPGEVIEQTKCDDFCLDKPDTPPPPPPPVAPPAPAPVPVAPPVAPKAEMPKMELTFGLATGSNQMSNQSPATPNTTAVTTTTIIQTPEQNPTTQPRDERPRRGEGEHQKPKGDFYRGEMPRFKSEDYKGNKEHALNHTPPNSTNPADCDKPEQKSEHNSTSKELQKNHHGGRRDSDNKTGRNRTPPVTEAQTTTTQTVTTEQKPKPRITNVQRTGISVDFAVPISTSGDTKINAHAETGKAFTNVGGSLGYTQFSAGASHKIPLGQSTSAVLGADLGYVSAGEFSGGFIKSSAEAQQRLTSLSSTVDVGALVGVSATASGTQVVNSGLTGYVGARVAVPVALNTNIEGRVTQSIGANSGTDASIGVKLGF